MAELEFEVPDTTKKILVQFKLPGPIVNYAFPPHIHADGKEGDEQHAARTARPAGERLLFQENALLKMPGLLEGADQNGFVLRRARAQERMSEGGTVFRGGVEKTRPPQPYTVMEFTFYRPREEDVEDPELLSSRRAYFYVCANMHYWHYAGVYKNLDDDPALHHLVMHFAGREDDRKETEIGPELDFGIQSYQSLKRPKVAAKKPPSQAELTELWKDGGPSNQQQ